MKVTPTRRGVAYFCAQNWEKGENLFKTLKPSRRGLTFSLDEETFKIGSRFRYFIDTQKQEIVIVADENGKNTVCRKKSGKKYKPLFDLRSNEVKKLCEKAEYMEVELLEDKIIVHTYEKLRSRFKLLKNSCPNINGVVVEKTGEIVLNKAVGSSYSESSIKTFQRELNHVYDVVSLFSGAGLLDYSFMDPKVRLVFGLDFDENACMTYRHNIGSHIACMDIRNLDAKEVPDADILIGGPSCQAFSNANRKNIDSEEGEEKRLLIDEYIRVVKEKQPKVFVIENVPQFLTKDNRLYINKVYEELSGYEITESIVADNEVGGYTTRKRAIVIGSRIGKIELPKIKVAASKTAGDALSKVDSTWENYNDVTFPRENTVKCMSYVPEGGNWKDIPSDVKKFGPSTQSNTYRRLAWYEPSPTIANWRKCILIHPKENRILTVSEAAALMGLNKNFPILGDSLDSKQQQVANGVTQAIGRFVKKYVLNALDEYYKSAFAY